MAVLTRGTHIRILTINTGSSSLKFSVHDANEQQLSRTTDGRFERLNHADARFVAGGTSETTPGIKLAGALDYLIRYLNHQGLRPDCVGHRVVHGGARLSAPARVDDDIMQYLQSLVPMAPLHQPAALEAITATWTAWPRTPQVACFDTAFHHTMPDVATRLPLNLDLHDAGVRRYGFHGLSFESVVDQLEPGDEEKLVIAHLGSGSSLCAVLGRHSIDTTMAFTPAGGLPMATRSGDMDPGVLTWLQRHRQMTADAVEKLVNEDAGLRGLSGLSGDVRDLLDAEDRNPAARLALDLYCYRVRLGIGAFAAALGGLDTLSFTGGIGEHATPIRERIVEGLGWLVPNIEVTPSNEERIIARHTLETIETT